MVAYNDLTKKPLDALVIHSATGALNRPLQSIFATSADPGTRSDNLRAVIERGKYGDKIYIGPGTFAFSSYLTIPAGVELIGSGRSLTTLQSSWVCTCPAAGQDNSAFQLTTDNRLSGMTIQATGGPGVQQGLVGWCGSGGYSGGSAELYDLTITGATHGIQSWNGTGNRLWIDFCTIAASRFGIMQGVNGGATAAYMDIRRATITIDTSLSYKTANSFSYRGFGVTAKGGTVNIEDSTISVTGTATIDNLAISHNMTQVAGIRTPTSSGLSSENGNASTVIHVVRTTFNTVAGSSPVSNDLQAGTGNIYHKECVATDLSSTPSSLSNGGTVSVW